MATNAPQYFIDSAQRTTRVAEVPNADWDGGANYGGGNAPRIGVATAEVNPKDDDWPRSNNADVLVVSQTISGPLSGIFVIDQTFGDNSLTGLIQATGAVAPDGVIGQISGFDMVNRTGETLAADDWAFGVADN